jgi:hypothetical protein
LSLNLINSLYLDAFIGYIYIDNQYDKEVTIKYKKSIFESLFFGIGLRGNIGKKSNLKFYFCAPISYKLNLELFSHNLQEKTNFGTEEFLIKADLSYEIFSKDSFLIFGFIYTNQLGLISYLEPGGMKLQNIENKLNEVIYKNNFYPTVTLSVFL